MGDGARGRRDHIITRSWYICKDDLCGRSKNMSVTKVLTGIAATIRIRKPLGPGTISMMSLMRIQLIHRIRYAFHGHEEHGRDDQFNDCSAHCKSVYEIQRSCPQENTTDQDLAYRGPWASQSTPDTENFARPDNYR